MQELWNEICFLVDRHRRASTDEKSFQIEAENIFEKLGWSRYRGEISSQQSINVGSAHTVRPDVILSNGQENLYVVELKKPTAGFTDRNADQLISYMRLLKLSCGILLGDSVRVFYDDPRDGSNPVEIASIGITPDNTDGAKLLDVLKCDGFSQQRLAEYCEIRLRLIDARRNANEIIEMLCSNDGRSFIADAVRKAVVEANSEDIANLALADLVFLATKRDEITSPQAHDVDRREYARETTRKRSSSRAKWNPEEKVDQLETHPRVDESFQDYVRRTMQWAFSNQMLTEKDIDALQNLDYCRRTFALGYPLLVKGEDKVYDRNGNRRYWKDPIYSDFYCCSQWWKARIPNHERLFAQWVISINQRSI